MSPEDITLQSGNLCEPSRRAGLLRARREALGLSRAQVAARLGITRASVQDFEEGEVRGTLSLANFRRLAAALDAEAVIELRGRGPGELVAQPARKRSRSKPAPEAALRVALEQAAPNAVTAPKTSLVWEYRETAD